MALIKCNECGKEFSDKASSCPNCACPVVSSVSLKSQDEQANGLCLAGLIIGAISWFIDFYGLVAATGLTMSIIGLSNAKNSKEKRLATIGIILSSIEFVLKIVQLMYLISQGY